MLRFVGLRVASRFATSVRLCHSLIHVHFTRFALWLHLADVCAGYRQCGLLCTGMVLNSAEKERNGYNREALETRFSQTNHTIVDQ